MAEPSQTSSIRNRKLLFLIKLGVTTAIFSIILWSVDWNSIFQTLQNANILLITIVLILVTLSVTISALKWKLILSIHDIYFNFNILHQWYFVAMFLNNLLPSTIGGDGYRIFKTLENPRSKSCAVIAILVERLTGLLALLLLGYLGGIISFIQRRDDFSRFIILAGTACLIASVIVFYLFIHLRILRRLVSHKQCPEKLKYLLEYTEDYGKYPLRTIGIILISFIFQIHSLFFYWLLIFAIGQKLSIFSLAVTMALTNLIALLPISINGLGLIEGSFMYFTSFYGLDNETALVTALILRALLIPIGLIGGLVYFRGDNVKAVIK